MKNQKPNDPPPPKAPDTNPGSVTVGTGIDPIEDGIRKLWEGWVELALRLFKKRKRVDEVEICPYCGREYTLVYKWDGKIAEVCTYPDCVMFSVNQNLKKKQKR